MASARQATPPPIRQAQITVLYDGEALRDGSIDVRDLAPALLAIGDLFQAANRSLNGEQIPLSVRVQAQTRSGSYPIDLTIAQAGLEQILQILPSFDAGELVRVILGSGGIVGLFQLLKKLRGQKPETVTPTKDGQVILEIKDSPNAQVAISIPKEVWVVYNDPMARKAAERTVQPLESPGIDTFKAIARNEIVETIRKTDIPAFKAPETIEPTEQIADSTYEAGFKVIKPAFETGLRWMLSDGKRRYGVEIEDKAFLERLDRGERFGKGDVLKVRVQQKSTRSASGELNTTLRVLEVLEHKAAARQAPLFAPPPDDKE